MYGYLFYGCAIASIVCLSLSVINKELGKYTVLVFSLLIAMVLLVSWLWFHEDTFVQYLYRCIGHHL